jgi:DNA-binding MarR family transcriptional regulator
MPLKYITIPAWLMYRTDLKLAEKVFLSIVLAFTDTGGAKLPNAEIGEIVGKTADNVSRMITKLLADGWIKITAKQSRWRKIYFDATDKVKSEDTLTLATAYFDATDKVKSEDTLTLATAYFDATDKHKVKGKETKTSFPFSDVKPPQATPDPERVRRVLADLDLLPAEAAVG